MQFVSRSDEAMIVAGNSSLLYEASRSSQRLPELVVTADEEGAGKGWVWLEEMAR